MTDFDTYQELAAATAIFNREASNPLLYLTGKIASEGGEASQVVLKKVFHNEPKDDSEAGRLLKKELGDVLWYVAVAAREKGWLLSDVVADNLAKLSGRKERGTIAGSGDDR